MGKKIEIRTGSSLSSFSIPSCFKLLLCRRGIPIMQIVGFELFVQELPFFFGSSEFERVFFWKWIA